MNKFKNKFLQNNFIPLLEEYNSFFNSYKLKFVLHSLEILKKRYPNLKINNNHKNFFQNLYENFFIINNFENFILKNSEILIDFKENNINLLEILDKSFILMSNSFIKTIIKEKDSIKKLKKLTHLFEFYLDYIGYHINEPIEFISSLPAEIKQYYMNNTKLQLLSIYKGIPISHNTTIHTLNDEKKIIEVKANYYQIISAKFHKDVYLLEPFSNKTFKATVSEIYPKRKMLELINIEKINRKTPKRNFIRVQPKEEIEVVISKDNYNKKNVKMYDISLKGMAVTSNQKLNLEIGEFIQISFYLKIEEEIHHFNFQSELKSISKLNDSIFRYHLYFEPNTIEEQILEKYIILREKEIIKELQLFLKKEFIDV